MNGSPMLNGMEICRSFKEKELRAQAAEDEKVVRIHGCPTIVKKSWFEMTAIRARKTVLQALRCTDNKTGDVKA